MEDTKYYKWLTKDRLSTYQSVKWPKVKIWTPEVEPYLCVSGWHLATHEGIGVHITNGVLWEASGKGKSYAQYDKITFARARLDKRIGTCTTDIALSWAIECALRVLKIFEDKFPNDPRPREAIESAKKYLENSTKQNANAAANAAAYAAVYAANAPAYAANAAANAAYAAAYAAYANAAAYAANAAYANAAAYAAYANAANAAYANAAPAAANDANVRKERIWQSDCLLRLLKEN